MNNPGPRLRGLIARATEAQYAEVCRQARAHRALCVREEIEPAIAETYLIEALEIVLDHPDPVSTVDPERARVELFTRRDYRGSYTGGFDHG